MGNWICVFLIWTCFFTNSGAAEENFELSRKNEQRILECHNEIRSFVAEIGPAADMRKMTWNPEFDNFTGKSYFEIAEHLTDEQFIERWCLSRQIMINKANFENKEQVLNPEDAQMINSNASQVFCSIQRTIDNFSEKTGILCNYDAPLPENSIYFSKSENGEVCSKCPDGWKCEKNKLCAKSRASRDLGTPEEPKKNLVDVTRFSEKIRRDLVECHNDIRRYVVHNALVRNNVTYTAANMRKMTWSKALENSAFSEAQLRKTYLNPSNQYNGTIIYFQQKILSEFDLTNNWCSLMQVSFKQFNLNAHGALFSDFSHLKNAETFEFGCAQNKWLGEYGDPDNTVLICHYNNPPQNDNFKNHFELGEICSKCSSDFGKCEFGLCTRSDILESDAEIENLAESEISELVNCHNEIRSRVANHGFAMDSENTAMDMRKMYWSEKSVANATWQAKYLRETLADEDRWRGITLFHTPENISNSQIIKNWCEDRKKFLEHLWNFRYHDPKIDEYLQIIHAKSAKFGCAINRWKNENTILVCAYKYHPDLENMHSVYQRGIPCGNCGEGWKCGEEQKLCEKVKILEVETTTTSDYDIFSDNERESESEIDYNENENEVQTTTSTSDYDIFDDQDIETTTELFEFTTEEDIEDPVLKNNVFMGSSEEEQDLGLERNVFVTQEEEEEEVESSTVTHSPDLLGQTQAPSITLQIPVVTPGPVNPPPQTPPQIPQSPGNIHINIHNNQIPGSQQNSWPHLYPQTGPHIAHPSQTTGSHQTPIIYHPNFYHDFDSTQNHQMIWVHPVFKNGTRSPHPIQMPAPALIGPSGSQGYPGTQGQPSGTYGYPGTQGQPSGAHSYPAIQNAPSGSQGYPGTQGQPSGTHSYPATQNAPPGSHTYPSTQIVPNAPHNNNQQMMWVYPVFKNGTRSPHPILMPAPAPGSYGSPASQNIPAGGHAYPGIQNTPPMNNGYPNTYGYPVSQDTRGYLAAQNVLVGNQAAQNVPIGSQAHGYPNSQNVPPPGTHGYPNTHNAPAPNYQQSENRQEVLNSGNIIYN